jgi:membrane protease YdiL (CAAX protease family)
MNEREETDAALINQVIEAARRGDMPGAEAILAEAVTRNPNNPGAWWLWSTVATSPEQRRLYLRQVLRLVPDHHQARAQLEKLTHQGGPVSEADRAGYVFTRAVQAAPAGMSLYTNGASPAGRQMAAYSQTIVKWDQPVLPANAAAPRLVREQPDENRSNRKLSIIALAYLALLSTAELVTVFVSVQAGILLHMALLLLLLFHTVRRLNVPEHRLWVSVALMPLIRIVSLTLPLTSFTLSYWFLFTSIPLFAATYMVMRLLNLTWQEVGVTARGLPLQLVVAVMGIGLGYIEYLILRPEPLISDLTLAQFWWPALILMISTGFLEELIFRGVLQSQAVELLGRLQGIVYVAVFFGVLHVGYHSLVDVIFVTVVGLIFGWIVLKTRSIIGVTLAHGLTNIMLFLIMPFVANGRLPLLF